MKTKHLTKELVGARGKVAVMQKQGGKLVEDVAKVRVFPNSKSKDSLFYLSTGDCCLYISIYSSCDGTCYLCPDCLSMHRDTQDVNHFSCNNHRPCSR
jgi:hypothetical protein